VIIFQDNLSCMALMKRGVPGSGRSRHINIRHFWVAERVANGEVTIEHLNTILYMQMRSHRLCKGLSLRGNERASPTWLDAPKNQKYFPYERPE
jgi:hypothetical protein